MIGWKIDKTRFVAVPFGSDGKPLPPLDLYQFFQAYDSFKSYQQESDEPAQIPWHWTT